MTSPRSARLRLRSALFDAMVCGLVGLSVLIPMPNRTHPLGLVLIGVAMAAVIAVRRRYPLVVMGVVGALALTQVIFYPPRYDPLPFDAAVLVAMYSVVKYAEPLWHGFVAGAVVITGIAIEVVRHAQPPSWWALIIFYVAVCGGTWLSGYTVRARRRYVAGLEERAATLEREQHHLARIAVADERATIARELHDVVAHSLAVMIVQADGATYAIDSDPEQARIAVKQVAATGREALEDMRRLVDVLRGTAPPEAGALASEAVTTSVDGGTTSVDGRGAPVDGGGASVDGGGASVDGRIPPPGVVVALDARAGQPCAGTGAGAPGADRRRVSLDQLDGLVERARSAGLAVHVRTTGERPPLPAAVELTVYRIVQECLTNVLRHAGPAASVEFSIGYGSRGVNVEVLDDGGARAATEPPRPGGHGLIGMRERVLVHGGAFEAGPRAGGGWRVAATVPVPSEGR